ncbi:hypothetical protein GGS23DRAFT_531950 [Durotheca rogersii]|uniref:uncharacterized protein n=1 Tax=Durotheca rogersii TaxID=419775 RepID=UPI002220223A|nr:uncharacterized protein GGS23DRAFT_531950 [Durotheca rogersii]KAI5863407.1 hypothetical protein GGS23DRAFT_531950 [Durotheca rogersii]
MPYCWPCERYFSTETSLRQHRRDSGNHAHDCFRCDRHFTSQSAKRQHVLNSSRHHLCTDCYDEPDFASAEELDQHDVDEHNMCRICRRYFSSPSNLKNHLKIHAEKNTECFGCVRCFNSISAMVLHLEAGTCASGTDNDFVTRVAFECHRFREYTFAEGSDCSSDFGRSGDRDFTCPTCPSRFPYMSGLLQHVESDRCEEDLAWGPLAQFLRYLEKRIASR